MEITSEAEMVALVDLIGAEPFLRFAAGEWNETTARAVLYVKLDPPCVFEDFWVEWPDDLGAPRKDIEAGLPVSTP